MEFGVLGPLEVRSGDSLVEIRAGAPQRILAVLLLRRGEVVTSTSLAEVLWGDHQPKNPANALQTQVSYLRKRFAAHAATQLVVTRPGGYSLEIDRDLIDAYRFERAVRQAAQLDRDDLAAVEAGSKQLAAALGLWRGAALGDFVTEDFALAEAARLEELRLIALELRNDFELLLGGHREVIADLTNLVNEHPFREQLSHQLMLALYRSGRQGDALRAFSNLRRTLVDEMGIEPGADLRDLERRILEQDPTLDVVAVHVPGALAPVTTEAMSATLLTPLAGNTGQWIADAADRVPVDAEPPRGVEFAASNRARLPAEVSALIGRETEIARLSKLLVEHRIVTLTGPGGAGKSRLAIETARRQDRPSDTWFIDLAQVADPNEVPLLVANVLNVTSVPGHDTTASISVALSRRAGLIVLDTCEHVVEAVATLIARILRDTDDVSVLATSRRPLNIAGEVAWPVPPLTLAPIHDDTVIEPLRYSSIALFAARASAIRADFELTEENTLDIAAICMALDGLPLAIELAAARVDVLSPRAIAERLAQRFDLLIDGDRDAAPRQRTLRGAIEWSIGLLDDDERAFFARLGVFATGFDLDAATAVGGYDVATSLHLLTSLVRQSMVTVVEHDQYRLLDTLKAYALDMLEELDADATRTRHARHYVGRREEAELGMQGHGQQRWLEMLRADGANNRAAFEWLVSTGDGVNAARLVIALRWFSTLEGTIAETEHQMRRVLEFTDLPDRLRAKVVGGLALLAGYLRRMHLAGELAAECIEIARRADDSAEMAFGMNMLALAQASAGDYATASTTLSEATERYERAGMKWGVATSHVIATRIAIERNGTDAADVAAEELAVTRATGDGYLIAVALRHNAYIRLRNGSPGEAVRLAAESLTQAELAGNSEGILGALHILGLALAASGEPDLARRHHLDALDHAAKIGHVASICDAIEGLALLAASSGDVAAAARMVRTTDDKRAALQLARRQADERDVAVISRNNLNIPTSAHAATYRSADAFDALVDELLSEHPP